MSRLRARPPGMGRFPALLIGCALASAVWTVVVVASTTSPDQARERRASPELPPPAATVERRALAQVSWYSCERATRSVTVLAPAVSPGSRPVVTALAAPGPAQTGTVLAKVADEALVAVETGGIFYRDLSIGASGADVVALSAAMARAGWVTAMTDVLGRTELDAWRRHTGIAGDTVRWRNLVAVPAGAVVGAGLVQVGDLVERDEALLTVVSRAASFTCDVPDPDPRLRPADVGLEIGGRRHRVGRLVVVERDGDSAGAVEVTPVRTPLGVTARLSIRMTATQGSVLAVPLSAVRAGTDGNPVVVILADGAEREIPVRLGVVAQGWAELVGSALSPGAAVRLFDAAYSERSEDAGR